MTDEPEEGTGEPPAIALYAIYAILAAVLIGVLILVGVYV